ncbi:MAG: N-6 DNA methylase [Alphaproteobacteria bacterium]|nr:N-6 DNA methylase [Alphaproteobacteria bacterium]
MTKKELGFIKVQELVSRFSQQRLSYKNSNYNETQTRRDFIDPFFKALGWDIDNEQGCAESYREVIQEDKVKIGFATKTPDYSFKLSGAQRLFFVEAKKPSIHIKDDLQPAYQIRRYGWSAKLNVSMIINFEEMAIYDCTKKPKLTDKSSIARVKYLTYNEYLTEWEFLWNTLSKEAVLKGSFDKFLAANLSHKGTTTVDKEFLNSLDYWRNLLAETISKENKHLSVEELNFVVQQTLDRIIFLRICEDRNIEPYGKLKDCVNYGDFYQNILVEFQQADEKYNSGLFNFLQDTLSCKINIHNKTIKTIIHELYYPECPYEFSVLSVEVLGWAYEQFLGKTITVNNKGKAIIEFKPEVRKAGGVYYTPQYIVDYMVMNTIGKQCENKTPLELADLKIVDPACGSGSFLLGAYQYLLNWHKNFYLQNPKKNNPLTPEGHLTTHEKKKILLNNIYGVDIDTNAVEITKLSLLLKCLEGETQASIAYEMKLFNNRVLPALEDNIKCGNSLIDTDYYDTQIDFGEDRTIKPFSWQKGFPKIFKKGGFDVVIGNPPYVFTRDVDWSDDVKNYFWSKFDISKGEDTSRKNQSGKINLYILFILKSTELLHKNGYLSFIIPNGLLRTTTYDTARKFILERTFLERIVDLKEGVFDGVTVSTIIINILNNPNKKDTLIIDANCKKDGFVDETKITKISQSVFLNNVSHVFSLYINKFEQKLFDRMSISKFYLKDIVKDIIEGIVAHKKFISNKKLSNYYMPMLEGKDIKKYQTNFGGNYVLFDRKKIHRARPDYLWVEKVKIVVQRISGGKCPLVCTIDKEKYKAFASTNLIIISEKFEKIYPYQLICALINSKLWNFYYSKNFTNLSNVTVNISKTFLEKLPLPHNPHKNIVNKISLIVENQLLLNEEVKIVNLETQRDLIKQKIDYNEDKINELVYELYNLTEDDISLVEA